MTRQTSIDCYNQIKNEGLLPKRRLETLTAILYSAPCTRQEALANVKINNPHSLTASRFTELRELGVIYERRNRPCRITGRNVIEWDLTDRLPVGNPCKKDIEKRIEYITIEQAEQMLNKNKFVEYRIESLFYQLI